MDGANTVFNECLNKTYHNDFFEPVMDVIYILINRYNNYTKIIKKNLKGITDEEILKMKKRYVISLFCLMQRLINDNKCDNLKEIVSFLCETIQIPYHAYVDYLILLFYPEDSYKKSEKEFYDRFKDIADINYFMLKKEYPYKIVDYMNTLNQFRRNNKIEDDTDKVRKNIFNEFAYMILAHAYLHSISFEDFYALLDCLRKENLSIDEYMSLNYNYKEYFTLECNVLDKIVSCCEGEKRVIV